MRKSLIGVLVALLAVGGIGVAVAVADVTTGTATQCATTVSPTHVVGVDGSPVTTVGGDSLSVCATATATATNSTSTVTTTVPGPTTTVTTTVTTTAPAPASGGTPGIGVVNENGNLGNIANPNQYSMVIGGAWGSDVASVVEKVPGRGLVYFSGTDVNTGFSTGVPYSQASANGWLLYCGASLCTNKNYPSNYIGDIGSTAYQNAWVSNVESYLSSHPGVDGIFIDDTSYDPKSLIGSYPTKYGTTAAWSAAELSFAKAVYAALHPLGYYVALNAGGFVSGDPNSNTSVNTQTWWKELGPYTDGLMNEYYAETADGTDTLRSLGSNWNQLWDSWQQLVPLAQSMGDDFIGLTKGASSTDTNTMVYGKASFLLEWNGGGSTFMYTIKGSNADPGNSAWTTNIGTPVGAKFAVGVGWQRNYTSGTVLVNPSATSSQTFTVNGTSYTLAATTAKIISN